MGGATANQLRLSICAIAHTSCTRLRAATDKNMIRVWEVRQQKNVASFSDHTSPVTSLAFSENGYHMASAAADGVKLWDLRKLKVFK